jgi:hypothetical protein
MSAPPPYTSTKAFATRSRSRPARLAEQVDRLPVTTAGGRSGRAHGRALVEAVEARARSGSNGRLTRAVGHEVRQRDADAIQARAACRSSSAAPAAANFLVRSEGSVSVREAASRPALRPPASPPVTPCARAREPELARRTARSLR